MVGKMQHSATYQLLHVNIDPVGHILSSKGQVCCVQPKFIEVLTVLARAYPNVVAREEIIKEVWGGNLFVGEKALTNAIWHLRKTFKALSSASEDGSDKEDYEIIETIRKSGYRLKIEPIFIEACDTPTKQSSTLSTQAVGVVAILLIVFIAFLYFQVFQPKQQLEEVTDFPGRELFPSTSPDERYLAFAWRKFGSHAGLYLKNLLKPEAPLKALTDGPENASVSVWSRDNQTLFYIEKHAGKCTIKSLHVVTGKKSKIANCVADITTVLTYSAEKNLLGFIAKQPAGNPKVTLLNLNDKTATELGCELDCQGSELESIALSPDAKQIVISRNLPNGLENLYLKSLETGKEVTLLSGHDDLRGISWHPTDDYLVVSSIEHGARTAYKLALDGKVLGTLPFDGLSYPSFSRSGYLYFHDWNINTSIMKLDLNAQVASSPFPLLQSQTSFRYPSYSSVSERLLFVSNQSGFDEIWVSNLEGDQRKQLTALGLQAMHPAWSPDGTKAIFTTKSHKGSQLQLLDMVTQQVTRLETGLKYHGKPSWSQDGSSIYISDGNNVFRVFVDSKSEPVKLTAGTTVVEHNGVLYVYKSEPQEMWRMEITTGDKTLLFKNAHLASSASWSVSDSGLYYLYVQRGDFRISYFDFANNAHKDIIRVPERSFSRSRGLTYIAEKQWLLFTGYEIPQVDIKRIQM